MEKMTAKKKEKELKWKRRKRQIERGSEKEEKRAKEW
jgi:hypothetical protein